MNEIAILIAIMVAVVILGLFGQWLVMNRAIISVIKIFRKHNAVNIAGAKTAEELGIVRQSLMKRMFAMRDYKPAVLDMLLTNEIVLESENGKYYLCEDRLNRLKVKIPPAQPDK